MDCFTLKQRYIDSCRRHGILPNKYICQSLFAVRLNGLRHDECILEVFLDRLKDSDFLPLFEFLSEIDNSTNISGVDIYNETPCIMNGSYILSLMHAVNKKLRLVHLNDLSLERGFLRDLSQRGLTCKWLNFRSPRLRKLNFSGNFTLLETLNLDFNNSLTSFQEGCFSCMPNLKHLSVCATGISNLWTTSASLVKLPSLIQLRFQNCLCCTNTGPCPLLAQRTVDEDLGKIDDNYSPRTSSCTRHFFSTPYLGSEELLEDQSLIRDESVDATIQRQYEDVLSEFRAYSQSFYHEISSTEFLFNAFNNWGLRNRFQAPLGVFPIEDGGLLASGFYNGHTSSFTNSERRKYSSHHPSPICFERHYRDYMIASLPKLQVLDNMSISIMNKESARLIYSQYFEYLPYKRRHKQSLVSILNNREINTCLSNRHKNKVPTLHTNSAVYHSRSLGAAKVGSCAWPSVRSLSTLGYAYGDESRSFRPRQFEYHPSHSALMAFGTLDGEVVVVNHENEKIFSYIPSQGAMASVLGLCWLKRFPSKLIAGSDNGSLRLYDINRWQETVAARSSSPSDFTFDDFDQLTSVHVNATDELFIASGYAKDVALYDIGTGKRLNVFTDMHQQHINVVKFSNHTPSIFATSSFDQYVKMWDLRQRPIQPCFQAASNNGNVMVCFSPDDLYLLVSAVDNEVKQLSADGRTLLDFEIASTGSSQNYTRSYYLNGGDYIISGSCDENVVRICCAQTGRRLRDISLESRTSGASMFVQSLRGDPFRDFNMSVLAAYMRPSSKSEIVKVNLLASRDYMSDTSEDEMDIPTFSRGA